MNWTPGLCGCEIFLVSINLLFTQGSKSHPSACLGQLKSYSNVLPMRQFRVLIHVHVYAYTCVILCMWLQLHSI